jgi:hypothetical protein
MTLSEQRKRLRVGIVLFSSLLVIALLWSCRTGGLRRDLAASLPRKGISPSTVALVKLDLRELRPGGLQRWLDMTGHSAGGAEKIAATCEKLRLSLIEAGVSQVALPLAMDTSVFENVGLYFGGDKRPNPAVIEAAMVKAGGANALGVAAFMASAQDLGGGWVFWGVKGGGTSSTTDKARAKRYEAALRGVAPAFVRVIILGSLAWSEENIESSEPRLFRQLKQIKNASRDLDAMEVALRQDPEPAQGWTLSAEAIFTSDHAATAFQANWASLVSDLLASVGDELAVGSAQSLVSGMVRQLAEATPTLEAKTVRWNVHTGS